MTHSVYEVFRQCPESRADFQNHVIVSGMEIAHSISHNVLVDQKILSEGLFGFNGRFGSHLLIGRKGKILTPCNSSASFSPHFQRSTEVMSFRSLEQLLE